MYRSRVLTDLAGREVVVGVSRGAFDVHPMAPGVVQLLQPHEVEHLQSSHDEFSFSGLSHRHRSHTSSNKDRSSEKEGPFQEGGMAGKSTNGKDAPARPASGLEELLVLGRSACPICT